LLPGSWVVHPTLSSRLFHDLKVLLHRHSTTSRSVGHAIEDLHVRAQARGKTGCHANDAMPCYAVLLMQPRYTLKHIGLFDVGISRVSGLCRVACGLFSTNSENTIDNAEDASPKEARLQCTASPQPSGDDRVVKHASHEGGLHRLCPRETFRTYQHYFKACISRLLVSF